MRLTASVVVYAATLLTASLALAATPAASAPATSSTTRPSTHGPKDTPKATFLEAYHAALDGDKPGFLACFLDLPDDKQRSLLDVVDIYAAAHQLDLAVEAKFGAEAARQTGPVFKLGVDAPEVENAKETIEGDRATLDMGTAGPGKVQLVKDKNLWKIAGDGFDMPNPDSIARLRQLIPLLNAESTNIRNGKYASPADAQRALADLLRRPPEPGNLP